MLLIELGALAFILGGTAVIGYGRSFWPAEAYIFGNERVSKYTSLSGKTRYAHEKIYGNDYHTTRWMHNATVDKEYFDWFKEKCKC